MHDDVCLSFPCSSYDFRVPFPFQTVFVTSFSLSSSYSLSDFRCNPQKNRITSFPCWRGIRMLLLASQWARDSTSIRTWWEEGLPWLRPCTMIRFNMMTGHQRRHHSWQRMSVPSWSGQLSLSMIRGRSWRSKSSSLEWPSSLLSGTTRGMCGRRSRVGRFCSVSRRSWISWLQRTSCFNAENKETFVCVSERVDCKDVAEETMCQQNRVTQDAWVPAHASRGYWK